MVKKKLRLPKLSLMSRIGIGFVLGIVAGLVLGANVSWIEPAGSLFLRLLQMVVIPLVFFSLVHGVAQMADGRKMARIGGKTIVFYLATTGVAIAIGLLFANLFRPGTGVDIGLPEAPPEQVEAPSMVDTLLNLVPDNPFEAMANGDILPIIVFAVFIGVCAVTLPQQQERISLVNAVSILNNIMIRMTNIVIQFAPFGVFALIAGVVGNQGADVLLPLLKLILVVYGAVLTHIFLVQAGVLSWLLGHTSPWKFLRGGLTAATFAYATDSSAATLPVTMKAAQDRLGVSKPTSSFVLPLGSTINMDGSAIYQGVVAIFISQLLGMDLTLIQQLSILGTALLASIGTAGVPSASLIMLTLTLTAVGIPIEAIGIVAGVDRLIGGARTVANIYGDMAVALVIDRQERKRLKNLPQAEDSGDPKFSDSPAPTNIANTKVNDHQVDMEAQA
jgi:Na+/H+-dicarboxylate symporter